MFNKHSININKLIDASTYIKQQIQYFFTIKIQLCDGKYFL